MESTRVENEFGGVFPSLAIDSFLMILDAASRVMGVGLRCDIGLSLKIALHRAEHGLKFQAQANAQGYRSVETLCGYLCDRTTQPSNCPRKPTQKISGGKIKAPQLLVLLGR